MSSVVRCVVWIRAVVPVVWRMPFAWAVAPLMPRGRTITAAVLPPRSGRVGMRFAVTSFAIAVGVVEGLSVTFAGHARLVLPWPEFLDRPETLLVVDMETIVGKSDWPSFRCRRGIIEKTARRFDRRAMPTLGRCWSWMLDV
jgi:hypothetical protein